MGASDRPRPFAVHVPEEVPFTVMPRGGHFAALEAPDLLAEDVRAVLRNLR